MPRPKDLKPFEARRTLAHRLSPRVDRIRQIATKLGIRPYECYLVWQKWNGSERGEGTPTEARRIQILPNPKVEDIAAVSLGLFGIGMIPVGSIRVTRISASRFTQDMLTGKWVPTQHENTIPEPYSFFYEIVEDGRGDDPPVRAKYRLLSTPFRRAGQVDWTILLEKISEDLGRDGLPKPDC